MLPLNAAPLKGEMILQSYFEVSPFKPTPLLSGVASRVTDLPLFDYLCTPKFTNLCCFLNPVILRQGDVNPSWVISWAEPPGFRAMPGRWLQHQFLLGSSHLFTPAHPMARQDSKTALYTSHRAGWGGIFKLTRWTALRAAPLPEQH